MSNLVPKVFYKLCKHFFIEDGHKCRFHLPYKETVVSDPFVEYLSKNVFNNKFKINKKPVKTIVAPSHVSPDLVFYTGDVENIFGLEVKTTKQVSGDMNFNSTPPCGRVVVEIGDVETIIPCYYLVVQLEEIEKEYEIGTMAMIDGDFINKDFDLYKEATGIREKRIDLGTYGDGMDRQRPMFVFPNPLGIPGIRSERSTLISKEDFLKEGMCWDELGKVAILKREDSFYAYQAIRMLNEPFTTVERSTETKQRQRLKINKNGQ